MKILGSFPKTRLRRMRKSRWIRNLVSENNISNNDLVLPIFVREGKNKVDKIKNMPGVSRYSVDRLPSILNHLSMSREVLEQTKRMTVLNSRRKGMAIYTLKLIFLMIDLKSMLRMDWMSVKR